jgi:translocation and assembly module TamA
MNLGRSAHVRSAARWCLGVGALARQVPLTGTIALLGLTALTGCALTPSTTSSSPSAGARARASDTAPAEAAASSASAAEAAPVPTAGTGVSISIDAPGELKALLERHLDLVRLGRLPRGEVDDSEWSRLINAAPAQTRELLQTEGYFSALVQIEREQAREVGQPERVRMRVTPGTRARVLAVNFQVTGELERDVAAGNADARSTLEQQTSAWDLPVGRDFRNSTWRDAKAAALARLRAAGYATASWIASNAQVDADSQEVRLRLVADSGPLFRYGEVEVEGLVSQDIETVRNLVNAKRGAPVTEALVLDLQDRLQKSGLFENISVALDADPARAAQARVTVRVSEAPPQAYTFGLGISANTGPRASVEHVYRRVFGYAASSRNKIEYGKLRQAWKGDITSHPGEGLYRNLIGGAVENLKSDTDEVLSQSVRLGRSQDGQRIERLLFAEAERSRRVTNDTGLRTDALALSLNFHGVWRDLDSVVLPTQGVTLNGQVSVGHSRGTNAKAGPYGRLYLRLTGYQPIGKTWYGQARAEFGQVLLKTGGVVPEPQQFRAGGDDSVRGYAYRSLGPLVNGVVGSGNVMYTLSGELARPISDSLPSVWGATFIDLGNAGESFSGLKPALAVGVGVRWRSPVGPLRLDWAYGRDVRRGRIHFSVGIAF